MKLRNLIFIFTLACISLVACKKKSSSVETGKPEEVVAATEGASKFQIVKGTINWIGSKPTGKHTGTLNIASGNITTLDNLPTSGSFDIDMKSLSTTDLTGKEKTDLDGHLKNADFFDVEKFPVGKFEISKIEAKGDDPEMTHMITGNLTLKGITKSVSFPVNIAITGDVMNAVSKNFTINRTEWGIKYSSGLIGTLKDKIINDDVNLTINLEAKKI
jgi:polyisoprenoid-binding protein YceI